MKLHIIVIFIVAIAFCTPSVSAASLLETFAPAPAPTAAVVADSDKEFKIEGSTGEIVIKSTVDKETICRIYSITGQLLATVKVAPSSTSRTAISAGCYIVKTPSMTRKVMVK